MNNAEREQLKQQLRSYELSGIDLDTPCHWVIEGIDDPRSFFQQLHLIMVPNATLYFEGTSIVPEAANFYTSHRETDPTHVQRDTLFPVPDVYHVRFSPDVIAGLCDLAGRRPVAELFDHVKGYRGQSLVFTFHDAFDGFLRISEQVQQGQVEAFCHTLAVSYQREPTEQRSIETVRTLRALLQGMENPDQVKFAKTPLSLRLLSWRNSLRRRIRNLFSKKR